MIKPSARKLRILAPATVALLVAGIAAASTTVAHQWGAGQTREQTIDQR
jgi:hypothetical protein